MMSKFGYYKVMSLVKQIIIAILATVSLVAFGWGSYAASQQLFPDPTATTSSGTPTPTVSSSVPTVSDYKQLEPKNITIKKTDTGYTVSFETAQKTGATLYVTTLKTDKVAAAMKDFSNGVPTVGSWHVATSDSESSNTHSVDISESALAKTGETYYYVLISYKASWLPYGGVIDYQTGPTEPYTLTETN
jgi:hypothetical protein